MTTIAGLRLAAVFLGKVRGYYVRYWWWDVVLHTASGFLLGILGFLLVHVLNEKEDLDLHMKPVFVALFAFVFALGLGALWEIFEFAMDSTFGLNMQKSGLVDTMWDLIVSSGGSPVSFKPTRASSKRDVGAGGAKQAARHGA